jgi:N-acetylmuramoyl-L-alanine amidase
MARRVHYLTALCLLVGVGLLAASGCQDTQMAYNDLPEPSFTTGPIAQRMTPAPAPPAQPARVAYVPPAPRKVAPPRPVVVNQRPELYTPPGMVRTPIQHGVPELDIVPASWIPRAKPRPWKWIVIHHTATTFGNEAIVTRWHIDRGFDTMGYDFLIGNGTNSGDGQIQVGERWPIQMWGAHCKTPDERYNLYGIGICLVGNFDIQYPSPAQMHSLVRLVAYMMKTYHIPPDCVLGHNDCKPTDCPGKHLSVPEVRRRATALLAEDGIVFPPSPRLNSQDELMHSIETEGH